MSLCIPIKLVPLQKIGCTSAKTASKLASLLSVCTTFAIMKKIDFTRIGKGAPYALVTGMVCFVAAYVITNPWIKNSLLLTGLAAVVISVGLYITAWKHE